MRIPLDPFRLLLISFAGFLNQYQRDVMDYLQEGNRVLREQLGNRRLPLNDDQRRRLAGKAKKLSWRVLHELSTIVTPETLLAWHRKLIARKYDGSRRRGSTTLSDSGRKQVSLFVWAPQIGVPMLRKSTR